MRHKAHALRARKSGGHVPCQPARAVRARLLAHLAGVLSRGLGGLAATVYTPAHASHR